MKLKDNRRDQEINSLIIYVLPLMVLSIIKFIPIFLI